MSSFLKTCLVLLCLMQIPAYATGFGKTTLHSNLGQVLDIKLQLIDVAQFSENHLRFSIADQSIYKTMGVDYHFYHSKLKLTLQRDKTHTSVLHIQSDKPINEPFLNFIIQLKAPDGTHLKEITALLELPQ
ncbi:MAG: hypothetical protein HRU20_01955 [Pseudomonadales bacterium]|nr:hypothetical protein [Pseudomonadales bacterium]